MVNRTRRIKVNLLNAQLGYVHRQLIIDATRQEDVVSFLLHPALRKCTVQTALEQV